MDADSDREVDVSIIVPTYDCRASLDRCLTSLLVQRVRKEIVVVDDGSRDGTRRLLSLYSAYHPRLVKVVDQRRSGMPGRVRNRGLATATGRYVFFCEPQDHLGPDALRRMVAMADRNGSDIVLGKVAGGDRRMPRSLYRHDAERVVLRGSAVYDDLSCAKLFRRSFLDRHGIRFDETLRVGGDLLFCVHAYCHAEVISIVAEHDCYLCEGGAPEASGGDPLAWLRVVRACVALMARHIPPGPLRDHLLARHFRLDVLAQLGAPFLAASEAEREKIACEVADICAEWLTDGVRARLGSADRARVDALHDLDHLARLARVQTAPLRQRLTSLEWRGDRLAVSGRVSLTGLAGRPGLVLRERASLAERCPPVAASADRFSVEIEVGTLPTGVWDVHAVVECAGARRLARFGAERDPGVRAPAPRFSGGVVVMPFFTRVSGQLSLDVGGHVTRVPGAVRLTRTEWAGRRLRIEGDVRVGEAPGAAAVRHLIWRERVSGQERRVAARAIGPRTFEAETRGLRPGIWDAYLELDVGGPPARFPVKVGGPEALGRPRCWWCGPLHWTARPYATAVNRRLSTSVRVATPVTIARRLARRLLRRS